MINEIIQFEPLGLGIGVLYVLISAMLIFVMFNHFVS